MFKYHFDLAEKYKLPMLLHNRDARNDFYGFLFFIKIVTDKIDIVKKNRHRFSTGVVSSFAGDRKELKKMLELDLYIGVSGLSLETKENLKMVKEIPIEKLLLETGILLTFK